MAQSVNLVENMNFNIIAYEHVVKNRNENPARVRLDGQQPVSTAQPGGPTYAQQYGGGGTVPAISTIAMPPQEYLAAPSSRFDILGIGARKIPSRYGRGSEV